MISVGIRLHFALVNGLRKDVFIWLTHGECMTILVIVGGGKWCKVV